MLASIRSLLAFPAAYQLWWNLVGGPGSARVLVNEYIRPRAGARILEIGCGPGTIVPYLPQADYLGFDLSSEYIEMAKRRFPQARFVCERVSQFSLEGEGTFDIVLALGIVHHLDENEAQQLFQIGFDALRPGGRMITIDGVLIDDQPKAERWLLQRDRGAYVRSEPEYVRIASSVFRDVKPTVRRDLLRIPFTHLILECGRPTASVSAA